MTETQRTLVVLGGIWDVFELREVEAQIAGFITIDISRCLFHKKKRDHFVKSIKNFKMQGNYVNSFKCEISLQKKKSNCK